MDFGIETTRHKRSHRRLTDLRPGVFYDAQSIGVLDGDGSADHSDGVSALDTLSAYPCRLEARFPEYLLAERQPDSSQTAGCIASYQMRNVLLWSQSHFFRA